MVPRNEIDTFLLAIRKCAVIWASSRPGDSRLGEKIGRVRARVMVRL